MAAALFVPVSFFLLLRVSTQTNLDLIHKLPGQPRAVGFRQFSGYVNVAGNKPTNFFYYFVEAETDPLSKPLVLWLNGGPGCSSLGLGAFTENGPLRPSGNSLVANEYSWNKEANMLYLESPVGVGFSYGDQSSSYAGVTDETTARDNFVFLQRWIRRFPEYRNRDFFIAGESYAGHYVPQLAKLLMEHNQTKNLLNLKGIALGNPVLEFATDLNSRAEYLWSHGLISDSTYKTFTCSCNYSRYVSEYYRDSLSPACSDVMRQVTNETSKFIDKYDVTLDVCYSSVLHSQMKIIIPHHESRSVDVCLEDETARYLNRKDVQHALHAKLVGVKKWTACSDILDYDVLNMEIPTISVVGTLIKSGVRVLIYSGDQDSVVPLIGSRTLVKNLADELELNTTVPYGVWFSGAQVGGWTEVYGDVLSFATVRGAAHEVPFSQPHRSLVMFKSFINEEHLPNAY